MVRAPVVPDRPLSQGTVLGVDQAVATLSGSYRRAEAEIREELERYVRQAALDPNSTAKYRAAQRRAALTRVAIIRADLDGQAVLFAEETMARVYSGGMDRADRILAAGGISTGQPSFTLMHRDALEMMAVDAFDDLAAATTYMDDQAKRVIREAGKLRTQVGAITGSTVARDTSRLVDAFTRGGVTGFVDAAGHRWRLSTYAEMVVRTKSAQAYNTGTILKTQETGTQALEILDGERSGHLECLTYNRRTASTGWALDHPILHPNCVRAFSPLPLHTGPVDYGTIRERAIVRTEDVDPLTEVRDNPAAWREGMTTSRKDGRTTPGEKATAATRELVRRGAKVEVDVDARLAARGIPKVTESEAQAAWANYSAAATDYSKARGRFFRDQTQAGSDLDDLFEILESMGQATSTATKIDDIPAIFRWIPDDVIEGRIALNRLEKVADQAREGLRTYAATWQDEARKLLTERRGSGTLPSKTNVLGSRGSLEEAASRYPAAWTDRISDWTLTVEVKSDVRGWNRTPTGGGRATLEIRDDVSNGVHELGHSMEEAIPGLTEAEWAFMRSRTVGPRGGLDRPINMGAPYQRGEVHYRQADLPDSYSAKVYGNSETSGGPDDHWELFTTGSEGILGGPGAYRRFVEGDDEYRRWILGVLFEL